MFKNILIPISSEFYSKSVIDRSAFLAQKFNSNVDLLYIIEEKTLSQADKLSDSYRTSHEKSETKKDIIKTKVRSADNIIFDDAYYIFKNLKITFNEKIRGGEYSDIIKSELKNKPYDLIIMGFEKECILNYRLIEEVDIPIWIETNHKSEQILAVCSNLAPNKKVPDISIRLSEIFGWNLKILYIVDTEDTVQVDENGIRSTKKTKNNLINIGEYFIHDLRKKGFDVKLVSGSLDKQAIKVAEEINANLIIIGREQKKKGILGLPVKNIKRKIIEKCDYSLLLVN